MKRKVPKFNIADKVVDIKKSFKAKSLPAAPQVSSSNLRADLSLSRKPAWLKILIWTSLGLAGLFFIIFAVGFYYFYHLPKLIQKDMAKLRSEASELKLPGLELGYGMNNYRSDISQLTNIFGLFGDIKNLAGDLPVLSLELEEIIENWPELVLTGKGEELIGRLKEIRSRLQSIYDVNERLRELSGLSLWSGEDISAQVSIIDFIDFTDRLITWLDSAEPRKILILLQNPSELRPGGGFVGSYAEVELRRGSFDKIEVKDINDSDRDSPLKVIPPRELQLITKRWRAADANWFFDFSYSAQKILELFKDGEKYDAVFGVSAGVLEDALRIAGPVELKDKGLVLGAENFLIELQKQVQIGQAEGADFPKEILSEFMPLVLEKIVSMDAVARNEFVNKLIGRTKIKDIQVYFKDRELQKFFENLGVAGRVFQIPGIWNGDYLAVVFGNVGGGKSDIYMKEKLFLQSQINSDGTLFNHLVISRKHAGEESKYSWYRMPNQGYLRVLVPQDAKLTYSNGGMTKNIKPPVNYSKDGYFQDALVAAMENNRVQSAEFPEIEFFSESGKKVFGTWIKTDLGKTSELIFDYSRRLPVLPKDGVEYEFVFERQSGASGEYFFQISAPIGFRFRENNLPVFEYNSSNPPGTLILKLTLEKI